MASWFDGNFDGGFDGVDIFDLILEDVEENQAEDVQLEQLEGLPLEIGFLSGCANVHTDAPGFQANRTTSQDESSSTKPPLSDVKPISGRSIVKSGDTSDGKFPHVFQTTSPVSVLESSNTHSVVNRAPLDPKITFVVKRPRTKRRRPESLKLTPDISYKLAAKKICIGLDVTEEFKDLSNGHLSEKYHRTKQKKENGLSPLSNALETKKFHFQQPFATRKCMHCETTSTPQWREGPQGPKTLCNACGVRYRTGRLFPEYRPAGSPTFVPSLHSNSHKKVMELRNNAKQAGEYCCKNTPS